MLNLNEVVTNPFNKGSKKNQALAIIFLYMVVLRIAYFLFQFRHFPLVWTNKTRVPNTVSIDKMKEYLAPFTAILARIWSEFLLVKILINEFLFLR